MPSAQAKVAIVAAVCALATALSYALFDAPWGIPAFLASVLVSFGVDVCFLALLLLSGSTIVGHFFPSLRPQQAHNYRIALVISLVAGVLVAPLPVFLAYFVACCRAATAPFTLVLGVLGVARGHTIVHSNAHVQTALF